MKFKDNSVISSTEDFQKTFPKLYNILVDKNIDNLIENHNILIYPNINNKDSSIRGNRKIFETEGKNVKSNNLIGFIGINTETIIMESRFQSENHNHFLEYLLLKVMNLNVVNMEIGFGKENNIYRILEYIFPLFLKEAMKKGIYKEYKHFKYNDLNLKGRVDIKNHIKTNTPFSGNISYTTRQYAQDNDITQLIRHTIEQIKSTHNEVFIQSMRDFETKTYINQIYEITPSFKRANKQKIIYKNKNKKLYHPYFTEYGTLQEYCLMILEKREHGVGENLNKIHGILFDVSLLWEEYIGLLIKDNFSLTNNIKKIGREHLFIDNSNRYVGSIYPDFIGIGQYSQIIADAKYKPESNIRAEDYHQILSYLFRFNRNTGVFIYPKKDNNRDEDKMLHLLNGMRMDGPTIQEDIIVNKLSFPIPNMDSNDFNKYSQEMNKSEKLLMKKLSKFIDVRK